MEQGLFHNQNSRAYARSSAVLETETNVGLSVFGGLMCAACADNSARVPEYRQPPSRRVDDLVCPQPPPRYRAAPSHGAQSSHGGSSSTAGFGHGERPDRPIVSTKIAA